MLKVLLFICVAFFCLPNHEVALQTKPECALELIRRLQEPRDKAGALVEVAKLYIQEGDKESGERLLSEALIWTRQIEDGLFKAAAIVAISEVGSLEHVERAAELAKSLGGSHRSSTYQELIRAYSRFGMSDKASRVLDEAAEATRSAKTKHERWYGDREHELTLILTEAARAGLTDQALKLVTGVKDPFIKGDVLSAAAIALAEQKQFKRALNVARSVHYEIERIDALVDVANAAAKLGDKTIPSQALAYALIDTRKYPHDPEQATQTNKLVSISLAYENNGQRKEALTTLARAEKGAHTIGKPGFKDEGMSNVALAYAQFGMFDEALRVMSNISNPWNNTKVRALAKIAGFMIEAKQAEEASRVLDEAFTIANNIDCVYFKYGISARSCFKDKATDFIALAAIYEKAGLFQKETETLDLAVLQNKYARNPPHQIIEETSLIIGGDPVGELDIIKGYLAAGASQKAIEVANNIKEPKARVVAVATIEFKLAKSKDGPQKYANCVLG
jgi:tetratricopeptide (TPR) repeat protein